MVIDTSALVAILLNEPERRALNEQIEAAESRLVSAGTFVETSIVIDARFGADGIQDLDLLIDRAGIEIVPVDNAQARSARRAYSRFGKGRHAASLNFGDCFAYALAQVRDEPVLCKGQEFGRTDIAVVPIGGGAEPPSPPRALPHDE